MPAVADVNRNETNTLEFYNKTSRLLRTCRRSSPELAIGTDCWKTTRKSRVALFDGKRPTRGRALRPVVHQSAL